MTFPLEGQTFSIGLVQFLDELEMLRVGHSFRTLGPSTSVQIRSGLPSTLHSPNMIVILLCFV